MLETLQQLQNIDDRKDRDEIKQLIDLIHYHDVKYYLHDSPEITDVEYDNLIRRFNKYQQVYKHLTLPLGVKDGDVAHRYPMLSIQSSYSKDSVIAFMRRTAEHITTDMKKYSIERKLDGVALELQYVNNKLAVAVMRGDGTHGKDVTANARLIKSIPNTIKGNKDATITVRGEVGFTKLDWANIKRMVIESGTSRKYASARNAASGNLQSTAAQFTSLLSFFPFEYHEEPSPRKSDLTQDGVLTHYLKKAGFEHHSYVKICNFEFSGSLNDSMLFELLDSCEKNRDDEQVELDGIVIKVDSYDTRRRIGYNNRHPKWVFAWKFANTMHTTKLIDVVFQVGKTGAITPVGILKPVKINGRVIQRASLANFDKILEKDIQINDIVSITLAKEVIPYIEEVIRKPKDRTLIGEPTYCPACDSILLHTNGRLECTSKICPARMMAMFKHLASRKVLHINGLGEMAIKKLIEMKVLVEPLDLFRLKQHQEALIKAVGKKRAKTILIRIDNITTLPLSTFILLLCVKNLSRSIAAKVAEQALSVKVLLDNFNDILDNKVTDVSSNVKGSLSSALSTRGRDMVKQLTNLGIGIDVNNKVVSIPGFTVVLTGSFENISRSDLTDFIIEKGGKVQSGISKRVGMLVVGKNAGSKLQKAKALGITILTEDEFFKELPVILNQLTQSI